MAERTIECNPRVCINMIKAFEKRCGTLPLKEKIQKFTFNGKHLILDDVPRWFDSATINSMDEQTFKLYCCFYVYIVHSHFPHITISLPVLKVKEDDPDKSIKA